MSIAEMALVLSEIVDDPDISIHDVMISLTVAQRDQPNAQKSLGYQRCNIISPLIMWYPKIVELAKMAGDEWPRVLGLVVFWHFDGLMMSGEFRNTT